MRGAPIVNNTPRGKLLAFYQPLVHMLWILVLLFSVLLAYEAIVDQPGYKVINTIAIVAMMILPPVFAVIIVQRSHYTLMSPMVWCLAAIALYYGLGPSLFIFGGEDLISRVSTSATSEVDGRMLWQTNVANALVAIGLLTSFLIGSALLPSRAASQIKREKLRALLGLQIPLSSAKQAAIACMIIGLGIKYGLTMPVDFGYIDIVLPGIVQTLTNFLLIAIFLLAFISYKGELSWRITFWSVTLLELAVRTLSMSKLKIVLLLLMVVLGRFLAHRNVRFLLISGLLIGLTYVALKPIISRGRLYVDGTSKGRSGASLSTRSEALASAYEQLGDEQTNEDRTGWWSRLCYTPYQAFAMQQYDAGIPGDSMRHIPYVLVPRLLWPNKPIISDLGREYNELLRGNRMSSTAVTVAGETYWNGGYTYVFLASLYIGLVLLMTSALNIYFLYSKQWIMLPAILLGIRTGLALDGWFVMAYVGQVGLYLAMLAFLWFGVAFLKGAAKFLAPVSAQPHAPLPTIRPRS